MTAKTSFFYFGGHFEKGGLEGWQLQSGEEALKYLRAVQSDKASKPDLVLVDLRMPVVNGFAVLEWLRGNMPEIRASVYSSSEFTEDREKASALGAVAYLTKSATVVDNRVGADRGRPMAAGCVALGVLDAVIRRMQHWGMHPSLPLDPIVVCCPERFPNALALNTFRWSD